MSDDKPHSDTNKFGTVFMGPSPDKESSLTKVFNTNNSDTWDRRTVSDYMTRVREKASIHVQAMLDKARANAETIRKTARQWAEKTKKESDALHEQAKQALQEAEQIRAEAEKFKKLAHEQGYKQGLEDAKLEAEKQYKEIKLTIASVLKSIEGQYDLIFEHWRAELASLLRTATEVATSWILSEERAAVLDNLLIKAVQQLEERQKITIRTHPINKIIISDKIITIQELFPELKNWEIQIDNTIKEGDLIVESRSGMVDTNNSLRQKEIFDILNHLSLPQSDIEQTALANISSITDATGISALAAEAESRQTPQISPSEQQIDIEKALEQPIETDIQTKQPVLVKEESEFTFPELEGVELPPDIPLSLQNETTTTQNVLDNTVVISTPEISEHIESSPPVILDTKNDLSHTSEIPFNETINKPVDTTCSTPQRIQDEPISGLEENKTTEHNDITEIAIGPLKPTENIGEK